MNPIYGSRRRNNIIVKFLCMGAALFGVTWLALILFTLFYNGLAGINLAVFTQDTPPPGSTDGGLRNAIVGSIMMTVIGVGIGAPLGLFAGTYLAEYGKVDAGKAVVEQREQDQRQPGHAEQRRPHAQKLDDDVVAAARHVNRVHDQFPAFFSSRISISRAAASTKKVSTNSSRPSRINPD